MLSILGTSNIHMHTAAACSLSIGVMLAISIISSKKRAHLELCRLSCMKYSLLDLTHHPVGFVFFMNNQVSLVKLIEGTEFVY